jgi:N6-L-threonylcarbamoyladenine synthase
MSDPIVLGIETSCDETAVGVVEGTTLRSSVLSSQTEAHARFGGIVPEVAARAHIEAIRPLVHLALSRAGVYSDQVDVIAATEGPGLAGALMVGYSFAKAMAWSLGKPFIGIDHMEGHLFAPRLEHADYAPPAVVALVSGGHSQIVHMRDWGDYEIMGRTIDDAAGEAFDKLARFMGLGYPGGPAIDAKSEGGDPKAMRFPRALRDRPYDFSFSGLKTSVVTQLEQAKLAGNLPPLADVCASLQEAIVDVIVEKTMNAAEAAGVPSVAAGGGVMANRRLRQRLQEAADEHGLQLYLPTPELATDNGAMIAAAAAFRFGAGETTPWTSEVLPGRVLGS